MWINVNILENKGDQSKNQSGERKKVYEDIKQHQEIKKELNELKKVVSEREKVEKNIICQKNLIKFWSLKVFSWKQ